MPPKRKVVAGDVSEKMKNLARENRENPTEAEAELWDCLSDSRLGVVFWRQHCLKANGRNYILDFYCDSLKLAVEIDGPIHQFQQRDDAIRKWHIEQLGIQVLRFSNDEVLGNPQKVTRKILNAINQG